MITHLISLFGEVRNSRANLRNIIFDRTEIELIETNADFCPINSPIRPSIYHR